MQNSSDVYLLFLAGGFVAGFAVCFWQFLDDYSFMSRRAYRRGHRHGLAQATLPPYLQDLSNGTAHKVS